MTVYVPDWEPTPDCLAGRRLVITGASRGIGRAVALAAARFGAELVLLARDGDALGEVADLIVADGGIEPVIQSIDFGQLDDTAYTQVGDAIGELSPALDGLLLNAGILGDRTPLEYYDPAKFREVIEVNLTSAWQLTATLMPLLRAAPDARVLLTSSGVGRVGRAYWGAYAISKFATEGLLQVLAGELEETSSIRVNAINPGATRTDMRATAYPAEDPGTLKTAEAIVNDYLYLLGPACREHGVSFDVRKIDAS